MIRLGVNIDHVATVRQVRGEPYPDPVQAAVLCELGGADNITCHLREDRRHIQDRDVHALKDSIKIPLNFEMAATEEMIRIAQQVMPHAVTLVPEKREERTTEGGLDVVGHAKELKPKIARLKDSGILVSLFIEPDDRAIEASAALGADAVEFHTGTWCHEMAATRLTRQQVELTGRLTHASVLAHRLGLQSHFGHGLNYTNAMWLQHVDHAEEANIGHAIVARAIFTGLKEAVMTMKELLNDPRHRP
ncbi:pyridoxine 5'-phosphate synthase [bacterium]|nr:pyridoxine 5'-phosphate synthase [bacterium]